MVSLSRIRSLPIGILNGKPDAMTISQTPSSVAEDRLAIARELFRAMVAKDHDRSITLCDSSRGEVVARHDPRPEQCADEIAQ